MARSLDSTLQAELTAPVIEPVLFALLTFRSMTCYVCSAGFDITFDGQVYKGLGTLGGVSATREGTDVKADGISLTLSGIDPAIMGECLADIQPLAPAMLWLGLVSQGQLIGTPYRFFAGFVDTPAISLSPATASITLKLESRMALLNRPSQRRYTTADQHAFGYADDTAFLWVEKLNDMALKWGGS